VNLKLSELNVSINLSQNKAIKNRILLFLFFLNMESISGHELSTCPEWNSYSMAQGKGKEKKKLNLGRW
jgi:hypothetical protein